MTESQSADLIAQLDEAPLSRFHLRAVVVSGMGFFTDAYDLFVIGIASTLIAAQWHLGPDRLAVLNSVMLAAAFLGALVFGRVADLAGRRLVYWLVAAIMIVGAVGSALAPSFWILIAFRFVLGFGVGGDYPVSAVMVSEYANRANRGRLVGMVFGAQALGLIVGPLIALALLGADVSHGTAWRVLLGLGAVPAGAVVWLRSRMPESPRYQAQVRGRTADAAAGLARLSRGQVGGTGGAVTAAPVTGLRAFLASRRYLVLLAGFAMMAACFALLAAVPGLTTAVAPFLIVFGVSYFFTEFGPNMTTFVMPSELYPVAMRATGHGISAGVGKLGAFIGVFLFPLLSTSLGLRGTLALTAAIAVAGLALTLVLPEPAGRSLDDIAADGAAPGSAAGPRAAAVTGRRAR